MNDRMLAISVFLALIFLLLVGVVAGRRYGRWQLAKASHKLEVVNVAEGAVFALLGLLVAFTFSGAYERFEARKMHIIEEANAVEVAYMRLDLLPPALQGSIREDFRNYLDARLAIYKKLPDIEASKVEFLKSLQLRIKLWEEAVAITNQINKSQPQLLLLPALNNMFDIANTRYAITKIHPPKLIFVLLIGLALLSAILAGYSTANSKITHSIHILSYVFITAFTIFVIMDLELPRLGVIRVDAFDQILVDVRETMN